MTPEAAPVKKELELENLGCASCAAKIERSALKIDGIRQASVDFAAMRMVLEITESADSEQVLSQVREMASLIEPGIQIHESRADAAGSPETQSDEGETERGPRARFIRIGIGAALFAAALVLDLSPPLELALFLASYLLVGIRVLLPAVRKIIRGQVFDEHFLMSIATIGAFAIGEYPEAVAVMLFYEAGEFFEDLAVGHSRRSISSLMQIRPDHANLKRGGGIVTVPPEQVAVGDLIVIRPGERIPLDGVVEEGATFLDTSAITGESVPREAVAGDTVYSGSINKNGLFSVRVTRTFGESTVSRILDLVQNASSRKSPTERFITRFARHYTPAVVLAAVLLAVVPPLAVPGAVFSDWLYRALAFLVVSCPCALVISIPLGYFGGIGAASRQGILVKGSNFLEALKQADAVVFDKTGTLTRGVFQVTRVHSTERPERDLLALAAHAEAYSSHPIAKSIVEAHGAGNIVHASITAYDELPGHGIRATIGGRQVLAGSAAFLASQGIAPDAPDESGTVVFLAVDGNPVGHIVISDEIKPDAREAIEKLRAAGIGRIAMLTGDTRAVGERIGRALGIDEVYAELLPEQKVARFEQLVREKACKGRTVFVGDGINDAPVLARADIGISMGSLGSDAAIEAADVVIMTDRPSKVAEAIWIARRTNRIVWQNIVFAFAVKAVVLVLSAAGLATLWAAVFADMGVALLAILNATRILGRRSGAKS